MSAPKVALVSTSTDCSPAPRCRLPFLLMCRGLLQPENLACTCSLSTPKRGETVYPQTLLAGESTDTRLQDRLWQTQHALDAYLHLGSAAHTGVYKALEIPLQPFGKVRDAACATLPQHVTC